jgi:hypothetical protein
VGRRTAAGQRFAIAGRLLIRQVGFHGGFVEFLRLAFDDLERPLGALADAGAETVAEVVRDHLDLTVNDLKGPLCAANHTLAAAVAFLFIYLDNLAFDLHGHLENR